MLVTCLLLHYTGDLLLHYGGSMLSNSCSGLLIDTAHDLTLSDTL